MGGSACVHLHTNEHETRHTWSFIHSVHPCDPSRLVLSPSTSSTLPTWSLLVQAGPSLFFKLLDCTTDQLRSALIAIHVVHPFQREWFHPTVATFVLVNNFDHTVPFFVRRFLCESFLLCRRIDPSSVNAPERLQDSQSNHLHPALDLRSDREVRDRSLVGRRSRSQQ